MQTNNANNLQLNEFNKFIKLVMATREYDKIDLISKDTGLKVNRLYNIRCGRIKDFSRDFEVLKKYYKELVNNTNTVNTEEQPSDKYYIPIDLNTSLDDLHKKVDSLIRIMKKIELQKLPEITYKNKKAKNKP